MVFGDMEEKVSKYKGRLRALGEDVSDTDDDGDEDEEGSDGDD
jgi:hypothetical protein